MKFKNMAMPELMEMKKQLEENGVAIQKRADNLKAKAIEETSETALDTIHKSLQEELKEKRANDELMLELAKAIGEKEEAVKNIKKHIQEGRNESYSGVEEKQAEIDDKVLRSKEYVEAYAKALKTQNKTVVTRFLDESGVSQKAITTATTGIGNGGLTLPTLIADRIETVMGEVGGILALVRKIQSKGTWTQVYEKMASRTGAKKHTEGTDKTEQAQEFISRDLVVDFIYKKTRVSRKMEELDNGQLATWLMEELPYEVIKEIERLIVNGAQTDALRGIIGDGAEFVTSVAGAVSPDTVLEALATIKNANVVAMPRADFIKNIMTLKDANGQKLDFIGYSVTEPSIHGLQVVYSEAVPTGKAIVGNFDNYTVNMPSGTTATVERDASEKTKNNTIVYLAEMLCGGMVTKLDGFAVIDGSPVV